MSERLATTGFFARSASRQIRSLASADPPGESIRSTIAATWSSLAASRIAFMTVSEPAAPPIKRSSAPLPSRISPVTCTTAIRRFLPSGAACLRPENSSISVTRPPTPDNS